jgi:cytochrome P450
VSKGFTPPRIRELEGYIRSLTTDILDSVSDRGEVEFVTEVAALLPVYVIGEMLGVPREDQHLIKEWSDATAEVSDDGELTERGKTAFVEMMQYLAAMQDARIKTPTDDLVSLLLTAEVDGRKLTIDEQQGFFQLLEFAGNETTRNSIAGGVHALGAEHPEEKDRLIEDPSLVPSAVEEILRYVTPVTHFKRTVMSDTEVRGEALSEGEELILFYSAGNRDPEVFPNPDAFDIGRRPNPQIALGGGGPHFCLGASLGRLEMRVMFEELIRRFPDFEVVGPIERPMSNFIRGIQSMPVKLGSDHG